MSPQLTAQIYFTVFIITEDTKEIEMQSLS